MNPRDIPDITEADQLLQAAEHTFPSKESAKKFERAFEILNGYLEGENPGTEVRNFIINLKLSYTRSTLTKLNEIDINDFNIFIHYFFVLMLTMKPEFDVVRMQYPDLGAAYDSCREKFKPQIDDLYNLVKRIGNGKTGSNLE